MEDVLVKFDYRKSTSDQRALVLIRSDTTRENAARDVRKLHAQLFQLLFLLHLSDSFSWHSFGNSLEGFFDLRELFKQACFALVWKLNINLDHTSIR